MELALMKKVVQVSIERKIGVGKKKDDVGREIDRQTIISVRMFIVYFFPLSAINLNKRVWMHMWVVLWVWLQGKNDNDDADKFSENYTYAFIC